MSQTPQPPLPKLEGFLYWLNNEESILGDFELIHYECSQVGQKIEQVTMECTPYEEELAASRQAWREMKKRAMKSAKAAKESGNEPQLAAIRRDVMQTRQRLNADAWKYKLCLANTLCPRPCQIYGECWKYATKQLGKETMRSLAQNQVLDQVCLPERQMILRCVGRSVASSVEAVYDYQDQNFQNSNFDLSISGRQEHDQS